MWSRRWGFISRVTIAMDYGRCSSGTPRLVVAIAAPLGGPGSPFRVRCLAGVMVPVGPAVASSTVRRHAPPQRTMCCGPKVLGIESMPSGYKRTESSDAIIYIYSSLPDCQGPSCRQPPILIELLQRFCARVSAAWTIDVSRFGLQWAWRKVRQSFNRAEARARADGGGVRRGLSLGVS